MVAEKLKIEKIKKKFKTWFDKFKICDILRNHHDEW